MMMMMMMMMHSGHDMRCLSFFYLFVHVKRSLKVVSTDYGRRLDFEQTHPSRGSLSVLMPNVAR